MVRYVSVAWKPAELCSEEVFEAVTVLGDNLLFSIMTFRLQTLSIRSNIILALRCLRLSDLKLWGVMVFKVLRKCQRYVYVISVLSVLNCQTDRFLESQTSKTLKSSKLINFWTMVKNWWHMTDTLT